MDILEFVKLIGKLKTLKRAGWVREKIVDPEHVADHSFRTAIISMVFAQTLEVSQEKLIKMALLHDTAESTIGDWVAERGKKIDHELRSMQEKNEGSIIPEIFGHYGDEYQNIFDELIERKTAEAKIFWQLDKLEMAIQALEYEKQSSKDLSEFFDNAKLYITHPLIKKIMDQIEKERRRE